jgi:hypothetical protein
MSRMSPTVPRRAEPTRNPLGLRAQVGGALSLAIGLILLVFSPASPPGTPDILHEMAYLCIGVGVVWLIMGTLARKFLGK